MLTLIQKAVKFGFQRLLWLLLILLPVLLFRWTSFLKHFGVGAWLALLWGSILIPATEHFHIENQASTFTGHNFLVIAQDLKLLWAQAVQILQAASNGTFGCLGICCDKNREIVAINQTYIIKAWLGLCLSEAKFEPV